MVSYTQIRKEVQNRNYAAIPFPLSRQELEQTASDFLDFLTLPLELKVRFYTIIDPNNRGSSIGYVRKQKKDGDDEKEYFHYHESIDDKLKEFLALKNPKIDTFITSTKRVYAAAKETVSRIVREFEHEFIGLPECFFPRNKSPNFRLRFLKYNVLSRGELIARGHYDLNGITLALAESAPGLRIGWNPSDVREVEHLPGYALFMPALGFDEYTSAEFPPTWHEVVQKSEDTYSKDVARWSIVFFAGFTPSKSPSLEETHTPRY